jgi:DNA-binding NtrC family response regulator
MISRILVVSDHAALHARLVATLGDACELVRARGPDPARVALASGEFDAVVIDASDDDALPTEVLAAARTRSPTPLAIVVTGPATVEHAIATLGRGARAGRLGALTYRDALDRARTDGVRRYLEELLLECTGNVAAAAIRAAVERESFYRLCRKYGVDPGAYRGGGLRVPNPRPVGE